MRGGILGALNVHGNVHLNDIVMHAEHSKTTSLACPTHLCKCKKITNGPQIVGQVSHLVRADGTDDDHALERVQLVVPRVWQGALVRFTGIVHCLPVGQVL